MYTEQTTINKQNNLPTDWCHTQTHAHNLYTWTVWDSSVWCTLRALPEPRTKIRKQKAALYTVDKCITETFWDSMFMCFCRNHAQCRNIRRVYISSYGPHRLTTGVGTLYTANMTPWETNSPDMQHRHMYSHCLRTNLRWLWQQRRNR